MHHDKILICIDCGADFAFTVDEQEFYAAHQLTNEPKRCKPCREKKKNLARQAPALASPPSVPEVREGDAKPRYRIVCNACGLEDEVPFRPKEGRQVFCRRCYAGRRR